MNITSLQVSLRQRWQGDGPAGNDHVGPSIPRRHRPRVVVITLLVAVIACLATVVTTAPSSEALGTDFWVQVGADIDGQSIADNAGTSVALSDDGKTVAIGLPGATPQRVDVYTAGHYYLVHLYTAWHVYTAFHY